MGGTHDLSWWPTETEPADGTVGIVTVNWNTRDLVAMLIWSAHRVLSPGSFELLVVDNASVDGSGDLLEGCARLGLCSVVMNESNLYHGPALNQAVSEFARRRATGSSAVTRIWVLDSDCVVVRGGVLESAAEESDRTGAAVLGERQWDPWHEVERVATHSLFMDPARAWRPPVRPFQEDGDPSFDFQQSCLEAGLGIGPFPFVSDGYIIHRGRGTLEQVAARADAGNRYHQWSIEHKDPHFDLVAGAEARYADLVEQFRQAVGPLTPENLARGV